MAIEYRRGAFLLGELARALRLDRRMMSMKLEIECSKPPLVTVVFHADAKDTVALEEALKRYELTEADSPSHAQA